MRNFNKKLSALKFEKKFNCDQFLYSYGVLKMAILEQQNLRWFLFSDFLLSNSAFLIKKFLPSVALIHFVII